MFEWVKGVNQKMNIASKLLTFIKKLFGRYNYLEELRKKE